MRIRTNLIIEESLLAKIDVLAGEKQKRSLIIEAALREYIAREESKAPIDSEVETAGKKVISKTK